MHLSPMIAAALMVVIAVPSLAQQNAQLAPSQSPVGPSIGPAIDPTIDPKIAPQQQLTPAPTAEAQLTRIDVESWLDGFMPYALQRGDIAGSVVVVVKDGEVLLQKGYGYADVAARKPVDPQRTLFRAGSVSKLFTWTAVMQLVEQGKLDLDRDINTYLDFTIPARDGEPITLRNLMTHTPGFEEQLKELIAADTSRIIPLDALLKRWTPQRIFPAGHTPAYSNYGAALAGYIVARTSGLSFDDYIDRHILEPLGMEHSSFRQPLPQQLQADMSQGYAVASGPPQPYELVGLAPAGSLAATGADMARFMIAHLGNGAYATATILKPGTAKQMHDTALTIIPPLNRMLLGFYEANYNGHRIIAHGGDTQWFHSDLNLYIDEGVGVYVSFNSTGKEGAAGAVRTALFEQFGDRYLPGPTPDGTVDAAAAAAHAATIAGRYESSRRVQSSFMSLLNLAGAVQVLANDDNTISVSLLRGLNGEVLKWREIAPHLWRQVGGKDLLAAEVVDGRVVRFSASPFSPIMVFEPIPWWRSPAWLLPLLVVGSGALLLTSVFWPVTAIVRRRYRASLGLTGPELLAYRWSRIAVVAVLITLLAWGGTIAAMMSNYSLLSSRLDGWIWVLHFLALIVFVGGAAIVCWNAWVVCRGSRGWFSKTWSVLLAVSSLVALWVALVFHLIGFSTNY